MSDNFNKNRLAKNTILLYVRMLFTMWLNLYTTRLTLANLGVEDMGIYGVVGSIVSMFAVFSGGMGNAVQRFLTYEIGRDNGDANKVFIPFEATSALSSLGAMKEIVTDKKDTKK